MLYSLLVVWGISFIVVPSPVLGQCETRLCLPALKDIASRPPTDFQETVLYGRCLTLCAHQVLGNDSLYTDFGLWTTHRDDVLMTNCSKQYSQVKECMLGCTLAPAQTGSTINECRDNCVDECSDTCSNTWTCNSPCPSQCRRTFCRAGCRTELSFGTTLLPSQPTSFNLSARNEVGRFDITSAKATHSTPEDELSAFIFRVVVSQETFYILQASLTDVLDLTYFVCQSVKLAVAVVNQYGISDFTPHSSIKVHGESFGYTSLVEDLRPNFFGHTVITFEWNKLHDPADKIEALEFSVLSIPPSGLHFSVCGQPRTFEKQLSKNDTYFVLQASNPSELPFFGPRGFGSGQCFYQVGLRYLPIEQKSIQNINMRNCNPTHEGTPDLSSLTCERNVDTSTGLISVHFNWVYEHIPSIQDAITEYRIVLNSEVEITDDRNVVIVGDIFELDPDPTQPYELSVYNTRENFFCFNASGKITYTAETMNDTVWRNFTITDLCPIAGYESSYTLQLQSLHNSDKVWWRNTPKREFCKQSGKAVQPGVIDTDDIQLQCEHDLLLERIPDNKMQYEISLALSWKPPVLRYGGYLYEIYVGDKDIIDEGSINNRFTYSVTNKTSAKIDKATIFVSEDTEHLFLQIRTRNEFVWGEYSSPLLIPLNAKNFTECMFDISNPKPLKTTEKEDDGILGIFPLYAFILVGFGGLLVLTLLIVVLVCCCYLSYRKKKMLSIMKGERGPLFSSLMRNNSNGYKLRDLLPREDDWEIPSDCLVREAQLGEGCFGEVYKGFVRGPIETSRTLKNAIHTTVAIKYLKPKANSDERRDFVNEIDMMKKVAMGNNTHVVGLIGCVTVEEPLCLVIEYLQYGDLQSYLHTIKKELTIKQHEKKVSSTEDDSMYIQMTSPSKESDNQQSDTNEEFTKTTPEPYVDPVSLVSMSEESPYAKLGDVQPVNLLQFAHQIAAGMEYLSSLKIVHRDLACRNVLVGDGKALKIADFGLSRVVAEGDAYVKTTSGRLPIKWMAIESIKDRVYTSMSDVWAFGIVLWEIATLGGFPYPSTTNEEVLDYLLQGKRLHQPPGCAKEIYDIMMECWRMNPVERPSFSELQRILADMLLEEVTYIQLSSLTDSTPSANARNDANTLPTEQVPSQEPDHQLLTVQSSGNPYVVGPLSSSVPTQCDRPELEEVESELVEDTSYVPMQPAFKSATFSNGVAPPSRQNNGRQSSKSNTIHVQTVQSSNRPSNTPIKDNGYNVLESVIDTARYSNHYV